MKTNISLWAKSVEGETTTRVLTVLQLKPEENKFDLWVFPESSVTEEFTEKLNSDWSNGKSIDFPEFTSHEVKELTMTESLLPQGYEAENNSALQIIRTEWAFIVLSTKAFQLYQNELQELKEKIEGMKDYDRKLWDTVKVLWDRVKDQLSMRTLSRSHGDKLKAGIDDLFEKLKTARVDAQSKLEAQYKEGYDSITEKLNLIEQRIEKALPKDVPNIIDTLKKIQGEYHNTKLGNKMRDEIWGKMDTFFKKAKNIRFGDEDEPGAHFKKRMAGIADIIKRVERNISFDRKDLNMIQSRIDNGKANQIEVQLASAKTQLMKERLAANEARLEELNGVYADLEDKYRKTVEKIEKDKAIAEKKQQLEETIKAEAAEKEAAVKDKIQEAISKIDSSKPEAPAAAETPATEEAPATEAETPEAPVAEAPATEEKVEEAPATEAPAAEETEEKPEA